MRVLPILIGSRALRDAPPAYASDRARDMVDGAAVFNDSVQPVVEAGLVKCVESDAVIAPRITRERLVGEWADSDILVLGTHFGPPTCGHVHTDGSHYALW